MTLETFFGRERRYLVASACGSFVLNIGKNPASQRPRSILVVKLDEIGDMALATHTFALLKRSHPHARLTVLCKPFVKPLIISDPNIDEIITSVDEWIERYDVVVELRGNWSTLRKALELRPLLRLDRGTVRLVHKLGTGQTHEAIANECIIAPLLKIGEPLSPRIYPTDIAHEHVRVFLASASISRYAIIAPGARRVLRQWSNSHFASIITWLHETHNLRTICCGGPEDRATIDAIVHASQGVAVSAPPSFGLLELASLCKQASIFVGNESGPMHIAATFNIPVVGIFGPGVPHVFYPIGQRSTYVHHVLPCNPCDQIHCVHPENPCIQRVTVDEVRQAIGRVLVID